MTKEISSHIHSNLAPKTTSTEVTKPVQSSNSKQSTLSSVSSPGEQLWATHYPACTATTPKTKKIKLFNTTEPPTGLAWTERSPTHLMRTHKYLQRTSTFYYLAQDKRKKMSENS